MKVAATLPELAKVVVLLCAGGFIFWLGSASGRQDAEPATPATPEQPSALSTERIDSAEREAGALIAILDRNIESAREVDALGLDVDAPAYREIVSQARASYTETVANTRAVLTELENLKGNLTGEQWARVDAIEQAVAIKLVELQDAFCAIDVC